MHHTMVRGKCISNHAVTYHHCNSLVLAQIRHRLNAGLAISQDILQAKFAWHGCQSRAENLYALFSIKHSPVALLLSIPYPAHPDWNGGPTQQYIHWATLEVYQVVIWVEGQAVLRLQGAHYIYMWVVAVYVSHVPWRLTFGSEETCQAFEAPVQNRTQSMPWHCPIRLIAGQAQISPSFCFFGVCFYESRIQSSSKWANNRNARCIKCLKCLEGVRCAVR